ncbi:MAG: hypothetical protein O6939_12135 [Bacteroidetes bacterium]|nr:hypothetical protein [Bacteroidota bacterium]
MAVAFDSLKIASSLENDTQAFIRAEHLYVDLNILEVLLGDYTLRSLYLKNAVVNLKISSSGQPNFQIIKKRDTISGVGDSFTLERIRLEEVEILYHNEQSKIKIHLVIRQSSARFSQQPDELLLTLVGDGTNRTIQLDGSNFVRDQRLQINTRVRYQKSKKRFTISQSDLKIENSNFRLAGFLETGENPKVKLKMSSTNANLAQILSWLPRRLNKNMVKFKSKGNVEFEMNLQGDLTENSNPHMDINFKGKGLSFYHPLIDNWINKLSLQGSFSNGNRNSLRTSTLEFSRIKGKLNGESIMGNLKLSNFSRFGIEGNFQTTQYIQEMQRLFPLSFLDQGEGRVTLDLNFKGDTPKKGAKTSISVSDGAIEVKQAKLHFNRLPWILQQCQGNLSFDQNSLDINNFSGKIGESDFTITGTAQNFRLIASDSIIPFNFKGSLQSEYIDLEKLLFTVVDSLGPQDSITRIPRHWTSAIDCEIKSLKFKKFVGHDIKGSVKLKNQKFYIPHLSVNTIDGTVDLISQADFSHPDSIFIHYLAHLDRIDIDSLFEVFNNFGQDFLVAHHLEGQINAIADIQTAFDRQWKFDGGKLAAEIDFIIVNGQLNDFAPIFKLSKYLNDEPLHRLRFSEIQNQVSIKDRVIYLPEMEVNTNVLSIKISGSHTFDQKIDYYIQAPLRRKKKDDEEFTKLDPDQTKVYLAIRGTTDDYEVTVDKKATFKEIKQNILRTFFKSKKDKTPEVELDDEEYLELEEEGDF